MTDRGDTACTPSGARDRPQFGRPGYARGYLLISTSLDHVVPGGRGGSWSSPENLVTSCWPCNTGKADFTVEEIGWKLLDEAEVRGDWTGLTSHYRALWQAAGEPDTDYHRKRLALLA